MPSSRNHQGAHGIGQVEEQLAQQAEAARQIQGASKTDQAVVDAAHEHSCELEEIVDI